MRKPFNRRAFIKNTSLGAMATPFLVRGKNKEDEQDAEGPLIKSYKILGRTGFQVSDIGI